MENFYEEQAGSGIAYYSGNQFQKGSGFLGRFFKGTIFPLIKRALPYITGVALDSAGDIAKRVREGESLKSAARTTLKRTAGAIAEDSARSFKRKMTGGRRKASKVGRRRVKKPARPPRLF